MALQGLLGNMHTYVQVCACGDQRSPHSALYVLIYYYYYFVFSRQVYLCRLGCPRACSADQAAGLELRDLSASASQVLGLTACAISA